MNYSELKELIALVDKSSLTSFRLDMDNISLKMEKHEHNNQVQTKEIRTYSTMPATEPVIHQIPPELAGIIDERNDEANKPGNLVKSPLVGTYYDSPAPDSPSFVSVGDRVSKGEVLCIIEAMKVMNEITSEFSGEVAEILVPNEAVVEYGQALFRIV